MANKPFFLKYELDTELLIGRNTPPEYAKPKFLELVYSWMGGTRALFTRLTTVQSEIKDYLKYNNQTIILEELLNDLFDSSLRRIKIGNYSFDVCYESESVDSSYVGYHSESNSFAALISSQGVTIATVTVTLPAGATYKEEVIQILKDYMFFGTETIII